ncbi:MAG: hypothetical protein V3W51_00055 [Candidatus Brocadiales bacterium]
MGVFMGGGATKRDKNYEYEPWYKYGVMFLYLEMFIAIVVSIYSLYMAFTGTGGFPGKH